MQILGKAFSFILLRVYYALITLFSAFILSMSARLENRKAPLSEPPRNDHEGDDYIEPVVDRLPGIRGSALKYSKS
jgi:hypothetical protein